MLFARRFALLLTASLYLFLSARAQSPAELRGRLDEAAPRWLKQYDVPSAAVAYIAHGSLAWIAVYGNQAPGVPATGNTLYEIASLTKPISAETILRLASRGKLSLDEKMSPVWLDPDLKGNAWADLLTPRLCLAHETGFANWRRMTEGKLAFAFQPGTRMSYSGEGYMYVARFTGKKLAVPFDVLAQENVFVPLGMHDTSYTPQPWFAGRLAVPHIDGKDTPETLQPDWNAADRVHTTIGDYARFVLAVMHNEGITPALAQQRVAIHRDIVTPADASKVCSAAGLGPGLGPGRPCQLSVGMSLGWQILHLNGTTILSHTGSDPGFHSIAFFEPASGTGVVVFTNGESGEKVFGQIARLLYANPLFAATLP